MTVPYTTPAKANTTLASVLAASELIDSYCSPGDVLVNQWAQLTLTVWMDGNTPRLALPRRPIWSAEIASKQTDNELIYPMPHEAARYYAATSLTLQRPPHNYGTVLLDALWGWNMPNMGAANWRATSVLDGDIASSTTIQTSVADRFEPGYLLNIIDSTVLDGVTLHFNEYAYVNTDGTLTRMLHRSGAQQQITSTAIIEIVTMPYGLEWATNTAARRIEQIQRSPGMHAADSLNSQAIIHNLTRSLEQYRRGYA